VHIVQLANFHAPRSGGLRTAVDQLGAGYAAAGHVTTLVVPGPHDDARTRRAGRVVALRAPRVGGGYRVVVEPWRVAAVLDELSPDVIEVSDKLTFTAAARWGRRRGVRTVLLSHERLDAMLADRLGLRGPARLLTRRPVDAWNCRLARRFDAVVVTTRFSAREWTRNGVEPSLVRLGVDRDVFAPRLTARAGGGLRLVHAGRLSPEKRPELAVEAVAVLVRGGFDVSLEMLGDGPARHRLEAAARGLPVTFRGHVADRAALAGRLAAADVALTPAPSETFGLGVLEALACGTPVVTSAGSGATELLAPFAGQAGRATGEGLAAAVRALLDVPEAVRRAAARRRAEEFPWSATVDAMLAVLGGRPEARGPCAPSLTWSTRQPAGTRRPCGDGPAGWTSAH
jgi:alpha-1,6-mannosyltransferase